MPGLEQIPSFTNETIFSLNTLPKRLAILGAGPVGVEMAQAFQRLGSQVTVIAKESRILPRDDEELALLLQGILQGEGIEFRLGAEGNAGMLRELRADAVLIATGRTATMHGLNLEAAGVKYSERGIEVAAHCRTSAKHTSTPAAT